MFEYDNFGEPVDSICLEVPCGLQKADLLQWYRASLNLPYFGFNWDSLYDVLCDLSWIKEKYINITHCDLPDLSESDLSAYIGILFDAISNWNSGDKHILSIRFPPSEKNKLNELTGSFQKIGN
jgi:hypothetical protein